MAQTIYQVDSFTREPFAGNPAAVVILQQAADKQWMQNVAREINLSETAFLVPRGSEFDLRWFTPSVEVNLCGHATLASAHILWEVGVLDARAEARFHTKSGLLSAKLADDLIEMDFPATPANAVGGAPKLVAALGVDPIWTGRNDEDFLIEVESEKAVEEATPDFRALRKASPRGVIITSKTTREGIDFVSRFFAPAAGIDEDPVTGSAHCTLAPYWADKLGKPEMTGYQASARGGVVRVQTSGDRVILGGHAVTVLRSELLVVGPGSI